MKAPVVAQVSLQDAAPDIQWMNWLASCEKAPEKGLVWKRIAGVLLIIIGIPIGLFGLACFPGLLFWFLGPVGLGIIGAGILLMYSKRCKTPENAFRALFKEAFFNADGGSITFSSRLIKPADQVKNRIMAMYPIKGLRLDDAHLAGFLNSFEHTIRSAFARYAGPDTAESVYAVFLDPDIKILGKQGTITAVGGTVNIVRRTQGFSQIVEIPLVMNMICLGGFQMPLYPVPRLLENNQPQTFAPDTRTQPPIAYGTPQTISHAIE